MDSGITETRERFPRREAHLTELFLKAPFLRIKDPRAIVLKTIGSTQSYAMSEVKTQREGDIIIAAEQTEGKGREGRSWVSQRGGLWMTIVLTPPDSSILGQIPIMAAKAVVKTLFKYKARAYVKPPNDVFCGPRKIGGVLADSIVQGKESTVYLGIGVNVNNDVSEVPEISQIATSLAAEIGGNTDLIKFTDALVRNIDAGYDQLVSGKSEVSANRS